MSDFWKNIFRYPRFFISSLIGSVLVILAPVQNLFKVQKFRVVLLFVFFFLAFLLWSVLRSMTGF